MYHYSHISCIWQDLYAREKHRDCATVGAFIFMLNVALILFLSGTDLIFCFTIVMQWNPNLVLSPRQNLPII